MEGGVEINNEGCVTTHIWAKKRLFGLIWKQTSANLNHSKLPQCTVLKLALRDSTLHHLYLSLSFSLVRTLSCVMWCAQSLFSKHQAEFTTSFQVFVFHLLPLFPLFLVVIKKDVLRYESLLWPTLQFAPEMCSQWLPGTFGVRWLVEYVAEYSLAFLLVCSVAVLSLIMKSRGERLAVIHLH